MSTTVPSTPRIKDSLPTAEWAKRGGSKIYQRRVKRMVNLLASGEGKLSKGERARQVHYWLEAAAVTDDRRMRSPSERLNDQRANAALKDSVKV